MPVANGVSHDLIVHTPEWQSARLLYFHPVHGDHAQTILDIDIVTTPPLTSQIVWLPPRRAMMAWKFFCVSFFV